VVETVGGALTRGIRRHESLLILSGAALLLVATALLPLVRLLAEIPEGIAGFALFGSARIGLLLARSVVLSLAITLLALFIGVPLGLLVGRMDIPGRRALWLIHAFPMFLPPFLIALGWFHLLGSRGFLGNDASAALLFSEAGLVAVLGVTFAPVVTSLVALALGRVDASLEEAARLVAGPGRVAFRILLPAVGPALALATIIVFSLAFSELGVPMFLRVEVFPAAVFARLGGVDYAPGEALALVLALLPIAVLLFWLERRFVSRRSFAVVGVRGTAKSPIPLGRWRTSLTAAAWAIALASAAPIVALFLRAGRTPFAFVDWVEGAPFNSLLAAALAATSMALVGFVIGHAAARGSRFAATLDAIAVLAFVAPAAVLGVGLIGVWNRPVSSFAYGTAAILVVGYCARYAVVAIRVVASAVSQTPVELEHAAAASGAGFARRLARIVLPLNARGIGFAWLLALLFCLRDLETAVLFYPPGGEPLTVRIFTLEANGPESVLAGLSALHIGMTAVVLVVGSVTITRWARW
jgi:iron(III) transport system permease protein